MKNEQERTRESLPFALELQTIDETILLLCHGVDVIDVICKHSHCRYFVCVVANFLLLCAIADILCVCRCQFLCVCINADFLSCVPLPIFCVCQRFICPWFVSVNCRFLVGCAKLLIAHCCRVSWPETKPTVAVSIKTSSQQKKS